ncbi:exo-alpha-sialidase [Jiangella asiatica]|uniref:exo-alpha-sialidase n=1 Tax=Jiangella asiatica TaxID=2530372 RepID=A0A4R5CA52_9ACTN|nr:exo-alpha-sialidase [Jiangella asiatica]TDD96768.1 hypothetical protein E1269_30115 [Jiangella asiatica]
MPRLSNVVSGLVGFSAAVALLATNLGPDDPVDRAADLPVEAENPLPAGDGPDPAAYATGIGPHWNVLNWGPGPRAVVPASFGMDTVVDGRTEQKVFVSSIVNDDVASADSILNMSVSDDSSVSFLTTQRNYPVSSLNMTRLPDGSLFAIDFIPEWADAERTSVYLRSWHSADEGKTWRLVEGLFRPPDGEQFAGTDRGLRVHRIPMVLDDGAIVVPVYTAYRSTGRRISAFLQSTDGGQTWTQRSFVPSDIGTNEVGWSRTADGRLVAVLRTEGEHPSRLRVSFSDDDAHTWTPAEPLLDPDGNQVVGIYPDVVLQPNGVMLLSTGRPDNRAYVDHDGTGETWDEEATVYVRYPSETGNGRYDGSSGNTTMVNVDADRTVFFGDLCHVWGCKAYHEQYGVFAAYVHAVTPGTGKIDLETKLLNGTATVTGTFPRRPDPRFPEQRPEGAFDGSSRPHSAAVLTTRRGEPSMTVELDREYTLNRIGLMLGSGQPLDATVQLSVDGETWSEPVVVADDTRDYAMRYTDIDPQPARFVRVTGAAQVETPVTEIEFYAADVDTFENDPLYGIPRGFTDSRNTTVTDQELGGHDSASSLRLFDKFFDDNAVASTVTSDTTRQVTSFQWATNDYRGPFTFAVDGLDGDQPTQPWRFRLLPGTTAQPAQMLEVSDGSAWTALGRLSAPIALNTWVPVTVDASVDEATVTIGGDTFTTGTTAEAADTLAGVTFTTGDLIEYGMSFFIDDLVISPGG